MEKYYSIQILCKVKARGNTLGSLKATCGCQPLFKKKITIFNFSGSWLNTNFILGIKNAYTMI